EGVGDRRGRPVGQRAGGGASQGGARGERARRASQRRPRRAAAARRWRPRAPVPRPPRALCRGGACRGRRGGRVPPGRGDGLVHRFPVLHHQRDRHVPRTPGGAPRGAQPAPLRLPQLGRGVREVHPRRPAGAHPARSDAPRRQRAVRDEQDPGRGTVLELPPHLRHPLHRLPLPHRSCRRRAAGVLRVLAGRPAAPQARTAARGPRVRGGSGGVGAAAARRRWRAPPAGRPRRQWAALPARLRRRARRGAGAVAQPGDRRRHRALVRRSGQGPARHQRADRPLPLPEARCPLRRSPPARHPHLLRRGHLRHQRRARLPSGVRRLPHARRSDGRPL
ncbi:MAG: hypothetical protein AVDCRST_MAG77-3610, partial [uncultured Chloroflexi bacterium]